MREYRRLHHRLIADILSCLDADFLARAECYFGGGTLLAMTLDEYRESRDIDFLCSSRTGFRLLREQVTNESLGAIVRRPVNLGREVRADRDGIRTFFKMDEVPIKFEIILEARIDLQGALDKVFGVPTLEPECAVAEKLLANADRGLDASTLSRDLVDLAFAAAAWGEQPLGTGMAVAEQAYGQAVRTALHASLDSFKHNRSRARDQLRSLGVEDTPTLRKGLQALGKMFQGQSAS